MEMAYSSGRVTIQLVDEDAGTEACDPQPFRGQSYEAIRAACLDSGILFRDPYFPPGPDALGYDRLGPNSEKAKGVEWKRPREFCAEPQFICKDMSRTDVCQGRLGNCWFLAAAASLTLYPRLLYRVVPPGQSFQDGYAGVFHFQLWQFGRWVDVVVDDRLPVCDGKLMFVRSEQREEFWAPLLEKAYAKLHGSYEIMQGGHMNEAFVDFTGGVGEVLYLRGHTPGLFFALRNALAKESLVGATALSDRGEYRTEEGLVKGHAYSVTGTHKVSLGFTKVRLLRLRNPWGRIEWNGAWSDSCPRWDALPPEWRDALLVRKEDGEFWMELQDFLQHFNTVQICSLSPEVLGPSPAGGSWHIHTFQGRWVRGFNSGGCQPSAETFWTNPQFRLTLLEPDEEKEDDDDEGGPWGGWGAAGARGPARGGRTPKCTVLLSLIQRNQRCLRAKGLTYLTVGFHVFQVRPWGSAAGVRRQMCAKERELQESEGGPGRIPEEVGLRGARPRPRPAPGAAASVEKRSGVWERGRDRGRAGRGGTEARPGRGLAGGGGVSGCKSQLCLPVPAKGLLWLRVCERPIRGAVSTLQGGPVLVFLFCTARTNTRNPGEIGLRTCEQLLHCFGHGQSLTLHHFQQLWGHLLMWQATFDKFDEDTSGTMNSYELRLALNAAGFHLNNQLTQALTSRYRDSRLRVDFDHFVSCAAQLTCIFCHCSQHLHGGAGVVCLTHRQWTEVATFS
nr:calpain-12 [Cavia porcellus]